MSNSDFVRQWSLKWVEGTILGFARDRLEFNRAVGMLQRGRTMMTEEEFQAIFSAIETSPLFLPSVTPERRKAKLKPLRDAVFGEKTTSKKH